MTSKRQGGTPQLPESTPMTGGLRAAVAQLSSAKDRRLASEIPIPGEGPHPSIAPTGKLPNGYRGGNGVPAVGVDVPDVDTPMLDELRMEEKKRAWASWGNEQFNRCKMARQPFENQWYLNLAFISGKHYIAPVAVPGGGMRLTPQRQPSWKAKLVINKIRTAVRTECSKLVSSRPIPVVVPSTNEDEDFTAARVAEQLLKNAFSNADFERTYRSWVWWGVACGNSFLKSYWSPNEDDPDLNQPTEPMVGMDGQPLTDESGEPVMQMPKPVKGRIVTERITPFHVYVPDLLMEDLNKQPYIIHATTRSPAWVQRTFGFKPTPDCRASSTILEASFIITKGAEEHLDACLVKEIWLKKDAHPDFPQGGILTIINDRVVQVRQEWPWPFPEYPFYKYDGIPTGGFYNDSIVVDLIPLNKEYNRTRSQMVEIKNLMMKPKLVYQQGSLNPRMINSDPGQAIPYKMGFQPPIHLPGVEIPASMQNELMNLSQDFDDISGQHEITRGNTPTSVTSGTAISFLQEQDDAKLNYQVSSIEYAMEMLGKHYLRYVTQYWDSKRIIKITGTDNSFESIHFKGNDLRGNTDVKIQTGSALPFSKAARQAMLTEFMQNGWIDPSTGMEMLQMGGFEKAMDEILVDKKQAQRENMKMAKMNPQEVESLLKPPMDPETGQPILNGQGVPEDEMGNPWMPTPPIPVNSWDNHEAHLHFHNQYRKTQDFELLDPVIKQGFEIHCQIHQLAMMGHPMIGQMGQLTKDAPVDPMTGMEMPLGPEGEAGGGSPTGPVDPNTGMAPPPQ